MQNLVQNTYGIPNDIWLNMNGLTKQALLKSLNDDKYLKAGSEKKYRHYWLKVLGYKSEYEYRKALALRYGYASQHFYKIKNKKGKARIKYSKEERIERKRAYDREYQRKKREKIRKLA